MEHMFWCPSMSALWDRLTKMFRELLKKYIMYGYSNLDTIPNDTKATPACWNKPRPPSARRNWQQYPPTHIRLPGHVPLEATIPDVCRSALEHVEKLCGEFQGLLAVQERPEEDPWRKERTKSTDVGTAN
jgi:hypothetical protein